MVKTKRSMSYGKTSGTTSGSTSSGSTSGGSSGSTVDKTYFLQPGESTADYTKRISDYNVSKGAAPREDLTQPFLEKVEEGEAEQPSPETIQAEPFTQPEGVPAGTTQTYEQAQQNLATGGLTGEALTMAQQSLKNKYFTGLQRMKQDGVKATEDAGDAAGTMSQYLDADEEVGVIGGLFTGGDKFLTSIFERAMEIADPKYQKETLLGMYDEFSSKLGLDQLDQEIIDAETIIDGTEDDIRNEVQMAGGFATDSQVQAMALARNKSLLKRYNALVEQKKMTQDRLNTMMSLASQDRQYAMQRASMQLDILFKAASFRQQSLNNAREQFRWLAGTMGMDGLYDAYARDPRQLALVERVMGIGSGGLASAAQAARIQRAKDEELAGLKLDLLRSQIYGEDLANMKREEELGLREGSASTFELARAEGGLENIQSILGGKGIAGAVGTNMLTRSSTGIWDSIGRIFTGAIAGAVPGFFVGGPAGAALGGVVGGTAAGVGGSWDSLSGEKQAFIGSVEQLRSQLSLDKLTQSKAAGATFGSLTEGEWKILAAAGSKLGTWAMTDDKDRVVGYNVGENNFKKEIDTINNYAKLDYILKGGDPASVGVIVADGMYMMLNSDGSVTTFKITR